MRIFLALFALSLSGCGILETTEAAIADAIKSYCEFNTPASREAVRYSLSPELKAEDVEICLACRGDDERVCTGAHRPKS